MNQKLELILRNTPPKVCREKFLALVSEIGYPFVLSLKPFIDALLTRFKLKVYGIFPFFYWSG